MVMESLVKIYVNELWYIWIENCYDKWMLLKLEFIDGYGIVDKNECGMCWKKDVWEYTCDDMYIVWMLWYYENLVVDRDGKPSVVVSGTVVGHSVVALGWDEW
jgi:hypothetical protein